MRRCTIKDIANACGLAVSSVSKALNYPEGHTAVSPETRLRVMQKAQELNYQPNWQARALASTKTHSVGFVFFDRIPRITGINESLVSCLEQSFFRENYQTLFLPVERNADACERLLNASRADGYLLFSSGYEEFISRANHYGQPVVIMNGAPAGGAAHGLLFDEASGSRLAAEHLLKLGHRQIAYYAESAPSASAHYSYRDRPLYLGQEIARAGGTLAVHGGEPLEGFVDRVCRQKSRPTALVVHNHFRAVEAQHLFWKRGVRIPDDLSLLTFNDAYPVSYLTPPMTAVALPERAMADAGVSLLLAAIREGRKQISGITSFPEQLIVRESTAGIGQAG